MLFPCDSGSLEKEQDDPHMQYAKNNHVGIWILL